MRRGLFVGLAVTLILGISATSAAAGNQWPSTVVGGANGTPRVAGWTVRANGAVSGHPFLGDARNQPLGRPIVGMAATPSGRGYWLVAGDGGVFSYGDARFFGSMGGKHLNAPIVGIASSRYGGGYWLVAADGGMFAFGTAPFLGSLGGQHLVAPIVGIAALKSGAGYRLVAGDGGIFDFGEAVFRGSLGGRGYRDVVGIAQTPTGNGYWILRKSGGTTSYKPCELPGSPPAREIAVPSVSNFGDARRLPDPIFFSNGNPLYTCVSYDTDFTSDPAVAIVSSLSTQGYVILRADPTQSGFAGVIPAG